MSRMRSHRSMPTHTEEMMLRRNLGSGGGCGVSLRHPLAFAGTLFHRVVINRETPKRVANDLGLDHGVCAGVVRMLKAVKRVPSQERRAVICQLDRGWDDEDVGEVFDQPAEWSAWVRANTDAIRQREHIPMHLEWVDPDLRPMDPSPAEILRRALEVRTVTACGRGDRLPGIRNLRWDNHASSFFPVIPR